MSEPLEVAVDIHGGQRDRMQLVLYDWKSDEPLAHVRLNHKLEGQEIIHREDVQIGDTCHPTPFENARDYAAKAPKLKLCSKPPKTLAGGQLWLVRYTGYPTVVETVESVKGPRLLVPGLAASIEPEVVENWYLRLNVWHAPK